MSVLLMLVSSAPSVFATTDETSKLNINQEDMQEQEGLEVLSKDMETGKEYLEIIPPTLDGKTSDTIPSTVSIHELFDSSPLLANPYALIGNENRYEVGAGDVNKYVKSLCYIEATYPKEPNQTYRGTAFVVGNNVLVTAGHCIYNEERGGYATSVKVYPQRRDNVMPLGSYTATNLHVTNEFAKGEGGGKLNNGIGGYYDIGIIRVGSNIASKTGTCGMSYSDNLQGLAVTVAGYPKMVGNNLSTYAGIKQYTMKNSITNVSSIEKDNNKYYIMEYNALDTSGGQSGAPVHKAGYIAVGVHTDGEKNDKNWGTAFNKIYYDWIRKYI